MRRRLEELLYIDVSLTLSYRWKEKNFLVEEIILDSSTIQNRVNQGLCVPSSQSHLSESCALQEWACVSSPITLSHCLEAACGICGLCGM